MSQGQFLGSFLFNEYILARFRVWVGRVFREEVETSREAFGNRSTGIVKSYNHLFHIKLGFEMSSPKTAFNLEGGFSFFF